MTRESVMRAELVDERTSGWELDDPKYRVYIWSRRVADIPTKMIGWKLDAYELEHAENGTAAIGGPNKRPPRDERNPTSMSCSA